MKLLFRKHLLNPGGQHNEANCKEANACDSKWTSNKSGKGVATDQGVITEYFPVETVSQLFWLKAIKVFEMLQVIEKRKDTEKRAHSVPGNICSRSHFFIFYWDIVTHNFLKWGTRLSFIF